MARSTRLVTASYILSFVAANAPQKLRTETIARWVKVHPARIRGLVAELVKAGLLQSERGASGGVTLGRTPENISLLDVYDAVQEGSLINETIDNPFEGFEDHCRVHSVLSVLFNCLDDNIRASLHEVKLSSMFVPFGHDMDTNGREEKAS